MSRDLWKSLLANGRVGEISATNSRGREERVFRDNSERERVCNCERRRMSERRKINLSYVYFEEIRKIPHFFCVCKIFFIFFLCFVFQNKQGSVRGCVWCVIRRVGGV